MSKLLERAVRNTTWSAGGAISTGVVGFLLAAATIRLLGVTEAGFAAAVLALSSIAGTLGGLGFGTGLILEVSRIRADGEPAAIRKVIGVGLSVALIAGSLGMAGLVVFSDLIVAWTSHVGVDRDDVLFIRLAGCTFLITQLASCLQASLEGDQRYDLRTVVLVGSMVGQTIATVIVLYINPSLPALGTIQLLFAISRFSGFYLFSVRVFGFWPVPEWSTRTFRRVWSFSRWVYAGGLLSILSSGLDRVVMVFSFGSALLPVYILSRRFYEIGHEILVGQSGFLLPLLGGRKRAGRGWADLDDRLRWFLASVAGWFYLGLLVCGPTLVAVLISPEFAEQSRWGILVFAFTGYFHAQAIVPFFSAQARGDSRATFLFQTVSGLLVLPTMYLLGRMFGFAGALAGQGVIGLVALGFACLQVAPTSGSRFANLIRPLFWPTMLLASGGALYVLWLLDALPLWIMSGVGSIGLVAYFPMLCRLEGAGSDRVETLRRALGLVSARILGSSSLVRMITGPKTAAADGPIDPV